MLQNLAPWFGYFATLLLAISLLVNNDLKFRWLNLGGCVAFIIYGVILNAVPIVLTNLLLLCINAYFLYQIYNHKELFEILASEHAGKLVEKFLFFYAPDIKKYFPNFEYKQIEGNINFILLRDLVIANIFSAKKIDDGTAEVIIDYTTIKFRDYKAGRYFFEKEKKLLLSKGIKKLFYSTVDNQKHKKFLLKMGFRNEIINGKECLTKNLSD